MKVKKHFVIKTITVIAVILGILAWSPWITEEIAREKVIQSLTMVDQYGDKAVSCHFSDYAGGVARKVPFGVIVEGTLSCSPRPFYNLRVYFVSPISTVHLIEEGIIDYR